MDIVIIGSGNVAAVLGSKFKAAGHHILQVVSRNTIAASKLAYEWDTESTNYTSIINKHAEIYIVAVTDKAIEEIVKDIQLPGKVVAHTAASVSKDVLKNISEHYGVFYPLQSLRKESTDLPDTPIFVDGNDEFTLRKLSTLAASITPPPIPQASDIERIKLHVAAVLVNNFSNHMYALAENFCKKEGIDFRQLLPLIQETASRVSEMSPALSQTGPATRNDTETIQKHMNLLKAYPELLKVYEFLTNSIQTFKP